jgi:ElaB/YqjD/DUF883 family membrane-anchored ribosome-binding protein
MVLPGREDNYIETLSGRMELPVPPPRPTQMPINPTERRWRARRGLRGFSNRAMDRARDVLQTTKDSAGRMYTQARQRAADGYSRLSHRTSELSRQTRQAARYAQQNYPVRVLGIIAASAFVVGIGLRVWRSRHS